MKTVLLVDDDENVRTLCERGLSGEGYTTRSVSSGHEALEFVDKNPQTDLIILDIRMTPLSGIQVLKRLRSRHFNMPVILYSDYYVYKDDFLTWLADAYILKSSDLTELKKKVRELLRLGS